MPAPEVERLPPNLGSVAAGAGVGGAGRLCACCRLGWLCGCRGAPSWYPLLDGSCEGGVFWLVKCHVRSSGNGMCRIICTMQVVLATWSHQKVLSTIECVLRKLCDPGLQAAGGVGNSAPN